MKPSLKSIGVLAAAAALLPFGLTNAQALPAGYGEEVAAEAIASLTADGLTTAEATDLLSAQPALIATGERMVDRAGADAAGMYVDRAAAEVVVNVVDPAAVAAVEAGGATARVVDHTAWPS